MDPREEWKSTAAARWWFCLLVSKLLHKLLKDFKKSNVQLSCTSLSGGYYIVFYFPLCIWVFLILLILLCLSSLIVHVT